MSTARRCAPARPRCPRSRARRSPPSKGLSADELASAAEGLGRRAGAAMRLLPVRPDHAGGRAAGEEQAAVARADRRPHGRQHLPLRHLSAHRSRHPTRREGGLSHEQAHQANLDVSRRGFVKGAAGLTFSFALSGALLGRPSEAFAAEGAKLNAWVTIGADNTITILCPTLGNGAGRADRAAADPRRRARRRLVEGEVRIRAGQSQALRRRAQDVPRRAGDARERLGAGLFHAAAHRGRAGPPGAARQRRRSNGRCRSRS